MQYHIQPAAQRIGITKRIGWHTFRRTYTTLLHANGEDVKVVQELLRHGSAKDHHGRLRASDEVR
jgi:site-specific recombinase XerD